MQLKKLFNSKVFLIGLLIRLAVMPFTGHYDIRGINFAVYNLPFKGTADVYSVAANDPVDYIVDVNFGREYFIYPPLNYFTLGSFMAILKPFYGQEFVRWIQGYGNNIASVLAHPHVFRYLFLMKIPYLFFDIAMVLLIQKFFTKDVDKETALKYWWLNPVVIFLPYMWGQFDLIPAFFVLWGILHFTRERPVLGAFIIGIGAAFKNYPLIFLPLIAVVGGKTLRDMIKIFAAGILPFIVTTMPYWGNSFFRSTVLFSWQSQKMLDFMWPMGGDNGIYPFMIGYAVIFLYTLYTLHNNARHVRLPVVITLLWYYATTNFHQQWFMWVLPFLVIYAVENVRVRPIALWVLGLFFLRLCVIQANVTTELFVWLAPAIDDLPKTRTLLGMMYDIHKLRNIVNSLMMGTALWITSYLVGKEKHVH